MYCIYNLLNREHGYLSLLKSLENSFVVEPPATLTPDRPKPIKRVAPGPPTGHTSQSRNLPSGVDRGA